MTFPGGYEPRRRGCSPDARSAEEVRTSAERPPEGGSEGCGPPLRCRTPPRACRPRIPRPGTHRRALVPGRGGAGRQPTWVPRVGPSESTRLGRRGSRVRASRRRRPPIGSELCSRPRTRTTSASGSTSGFLPRRPSSLPRSAPPGRSTVPRRRRGRRRTSEQNSGWSVGDLHIRARGRSTRYLRRRRRRRRPSRAPKIPRQVLRPPVLRT